MVMKTESFDRSTRGSHMPLDTELHWSWRNPLNILVIILLLFLLTALIGAIVA